MSKLKLLFSLYILTTISLFIYSFTQVDLSLTLSKVSIYQTLEKGLQQIGFFQRPLSASIFSVIVLLLFLFYFSLLYLSKKDRLKIKNIKLLVFLTFIILVFSYNAFSYDLFNYIFDAKIVTAYHQNPYIHSALDFSGDPMLSFMRWTHRLYPYGPSWLVLTVPLSFVGLNYFLFTFFIFKTMIGLSFLGSCFLIYKISEIIFPKNKIFNTVFWSFNPLVITEGLVSAHNDFPMIFFGLLSFYLYLQKRKISSFLSLLFSAGVKYSTAVLLPIWIVIYYFDRKQKAINWEKVFLLSVVFAFVTVLVASIRTTFQPWYLMFVFSMASFVSRKYYILIPSVVFSVFCSLIYIVYVYTTDYAKGYPQTVFNIEILGIFVAVALTSLYWAKLKLNRD